MLVCVCVCVCVSERERECVRERIKETKITEHQKKTSLPRSVLRLIQNSGVPRREKTVVDPGKLYCVDVQKRTNSLIYYNVLFASI